jgi:hypothetical protein
MSINKSQKYISGRDLKKQLEQRWSTTYKDKTDLTFIISKLMVNLDVIVLEANKSRPIIIDDMGDSKDHLFGIEEYLFDREEVERLENEDPELILEYMIDSELINDANIFMETDPQKRINRLNKRLENISTILAMRDLGPHQESYLTQREADIEKKISRLKNIAQKTALQDDVGKDIKADHQKVFPCKPGTRWEDIKIKLINDKMVEIETPQGKDRYSYHDLKMVKKNSTDKPRKIWPMLMLFANNRGRVDKGLDESVKRIFLNEYKININEKLPNYTKQLDKHLKELFGIKDSIFKHNYNKYKAYITKIDFIAPRDTDIKVLNDEIALIKDQQTLHETEAKDVQDKLGISDLQRFSDSPPSDE